MKYDAQKKTLLITEPTNFVSRVIADVFGMSPSEWREDYLAWIGENGDDQWRQTAQAYAITFDDVEQFSDLVTLARWFVHKGLERVEFKWTYDDSDTHVIAEKE